MTDAPLSSLLVMAKPDGNHRTCSTDELNALEQGWADLLAWLRGADPDDLPRADLVGLVAQKAGLRMVRFPEYDIRTWSQLAAALPETVRPATFNAGAPLIDVIGTHLKSIDFTHLRTVRTWLNRVTIELLYRDAPKFDDNRELLVSHLLKGPVTIQYWQGAPHGLALALKLLTRRALSAAQLTNLIHIESVSATEVELIAKSIELAS